MSTVPVRQQPMPKNEITISQKRPCPETRPVDREEEKPSGPQGGEMLQ